VISDDLEWIEGSEWTDGDKSTMDEAHVSCHVTTTGGRGPTDVWDSLILCMQNIATAAENEEGT
jgi:hypothetical protein